MNTVKKETREMEQTVSLFPITADTSTESRGRKKPMIHDYSQLPVALNAELVAAMLGISRAGAYTLMRSEGFPTLYIGKRMVVPKDKLLAWLDKQFSV